MLRIMLVLVAAVSLAGCEVYRSAEPEEIARARYVSALSALAIRSGGGGELRGTVSGSLIT